MLAELILFCACLGLGVLGRFWYALLCAITKKMNNRPATITLEFLSAGLFVSALAGILFFLNDGAFVYYSVFAAAIGFLLASLVTRNK